MSINVISPFDLKATQAKKFYAYLSLSLSAYIFFLFVLGRFDVLQQVVIWGFGPLFAFIVVSTYMKQPFQLPKELMIYLVFWLYTAVGYPITIDPDGFLRYFRLIFTIFILFMCIVIVLVKTGNINIIFKCFIFIAFLHFMYSLVSGDLTSTAAQQEDFRFGSLVTNPNGNAYIALTGLLGILFTWKQNVDKNLRYIFMGLMVVFSVVIVLTASRSGFLSMVIMYILWPVYCYRNEIKRNLGIYLVAIFIGIPVLYQVNQLISEDTYLGKRLINTASSTDIIEDEKRIKIYIEAFDIFLQNPIIGVGLSQFKNHSIYEGIAHSDSMELLSTTGIIGFLLILSIYVILWKRINKLLRIINDDRIIYRLNFFKVVIIVVIVFGLFKPNFLDILTMIKIALISGYTYFLYYELLKLKQKIITNERLSAGNPQPAN